MWTLAASARDPGKKKILVAAIAAALTAGGCCYPENGPRCFEIEPDPDLPLDESQCPSRSEALEKLLVDEVTSDGTFYPARTYVDQGELIEEPPACCYETKNVRCDEMRGFGRTDLFLRPPRRARAERSGRKSRDRRIADRWLARAATEHEAVRSFGEFALELVALGAPEPLIHAAISAIRDEARHTRMAMSLARRFARSGAARSAKEPDARFTLPRHIAKTPTLQGDLAGFVVRTLIEGTLAETLGVVALEARAEACRDPQIKRVYTTFAREEARHAGLGWQAVEWALSIGGPTVRARVKPHIARIRAEILRPSGRCSARGLAPSLGEISSRALREVTEEAFAARVWPALVRLEIAPEGP